jgi:lysozyme
MTIDDLLAREEGFEYSAYQDSLGYWTIGYGTLIDKRKGGGIKEKFARMIMMDKVDEVRAELNLKLPWVTNLSPDRYTVILAMAYQMGVDGLLQFKNTLAALRNGDFAHAAAGIRGSKWAEQTPGRAERMAKAIETGVLA